MTYPSNVNLLPAARAALDEPTWAYLVGGSGSEATLRRNRLAFERLAFLPRIFRDVSGVSPATRAFGLPFRIPVMMAPVGSLEVFHPDGSEGVAAACRDLPIMQVVAGVGPMADADGSGRAYQIYPAGDLSWLRETVATIESCGYAAVVLTGDVAARARRERQSLAGFAIAGKPPPDRARLASMTWSDVEALRDMTSLPVILKGVQTGADARIAVDIGVDGVWVSNHGGRQLDAGRSSLDALVEIRESIGGDTTVILDGGVLTGSDVLKAVALGADLVALGKLQCFALAAGGTPMVRSMLEVLEDEIVSQMGLLGVTRLEEVGAATVCESISSEPPELLDPWAHLR
jgi:isopentenyl diphosphate isomerase/L-lactate dehydrogenase-like FMN-dependent dehydrogenase